MQKYYSTPNNSNKSKQKYSVEDIKQQLYRIKAYFSTNQQQQTFSQNSQKNLEQYLPAKNIKRNQFCSQKNSKARTNDFERDRILAQNSKLKQKLRKEKQFRKQLNNSLQKQAKMIQNLVSDMSFTPSLQNMYQKSPKVQKKHRTFKQIRGNCIQSRQSFNDYDKYNQLELKSRKCSAATTTCIFRKQQNNHNGLSTRNTSKQSRTSAHMYLNKNHHKKSSKNLSLNLQDTQKQHQKLPEYNYMGKNADNEDLTDKQLLNFLEIKMGQLMRKSSEESNRANKLKIRNEMGRIVSQINKIKNNMTSIQILDDQNSNKQKMYSQNSRKTISQKIYHKKNQKKLSRNLMEEFTSTAQILNYQQF